MAHEPRIQQLSDGLEKPGLHLRPALAAHPNLTLLTRATVEKLFTDEGGRTVVVAM